MPSLNIVYAGMKLSSPIVVGSSGLSEKVALMKKAEEQGAGAIVMKSLFEKEVTRTAPTPRFSILRHNLRNHRTFTLYSYEQASVWGPDRYAEEVARARREVGIPVIPSINCFTDGGWASYARLMEQAGAPAIELNISCPHSSITFSGGEVVENLLHAVEVVRGAVKVPIIPKLSPQLTTPLQVVKEIEKRNAQGVVIFNRLAGLDIDVDAEKPIMHGGYAGHGGPWAIAYPLRWISEISPGTSLDIAASGGAVAPDDVVKYLLAGACCVEVCTALYMCGFGVIREMNEGLAAWMERKGYDSIACFRGRVSGKAILGVDQIDRKHHHAARVDESLCSGCGICQEACIYSAARVQNKKAIISDACDGCGLCAQLCPKSAISMVCIAP